MNRQANIVCTECGQPLYIGHPMESRGRGNRAHIGCAVLSRIRSENALEALRGSEKLPRSPQVRAA
jgi:hypothetical protein